MAKKKPSTSSDHFAADQGSIPRESRAVLRDIEAGLYADCPGCGQRIKFQAKFRAKQVICNVYVKGKWSRVDHFHEACYKAAGQPHGVPGRAPISRQRQTQAAAKRGRELTAAS
ncbi:hypothetical protein IT415_03535 [bacterium]|nr:hypothetical protein [bacterium]